MTGTYARSRGAVRRSGGPLSTRQGRRSESGPRAHVKTWCNKARCVEVTGDVRRARCRCTEARQGVLCSTLACNRGGDAPHTSFSTHSDTASAEAQQLCSALNTAGPVDHGASPSRRISRARDRGLAHNHIAARRARALYTQWQRDRADATRDSSARNRKPCAAQPSTTTTTRYTCHAVRRQDTMELSVANISI